MNAINLDKLVERNHDLVSAAFEILKKYNGTLSIMDMEGNVLINPGEFPEFYDSEGYPINCGIYQLGKVIGGEIACLLAGMLSRAADFEMAKKVLSKEVLDRYRELNLLYKLSEKLSSTLHPNEVAMIALEEANRILSASSGAVYWHIPEAESQKSLASFGEDSLLDNCRASVMDLLDAVAQNGKAQVINNVNVGCDVFSIMCAPIAIKTQTDSKILGTVILVSQPEVIFTAGDLELLNTVATQAAPVLELAFLHELELKEAAEREKDLQSQIRDLQIALDEIKQNKLLKEITGTDYFKRILEQSDFLRGIFQ